MVVATSGEASAGERHRVIGIQARRIAWFRESDERTFFGRIEQRCPQPSFRRKPKPILILLFRSDPNRQIATFNRDRHSGESRNPF